MIARLVRRELRAAVRATALAELVRSVLDLTKRELVAWLAASSACPATGSGPR